MIKHANWLVIFYGILIIGLPLHSKESSSPPYLKYVKEITDDFAKQMKKKHKLQCYASGGSMPYDVAVIDLSFITYGELDVDQARKIEVDAIQALLSRVNSHEKIRPYLKNYPFTSKNVAVSIFFRTKKGGRPLNGSVAGVHLARNKIFYNAAEIQMKEPYPCTTIKGKDEWVTEYRGGGQEEAFVSLHEESFEEALKIVEKSQSSN